MRKAEGMESEEEAARRRAEDADTARLAERVKGGESEAFGTIYSRYVAHVYNYLKVALGGREEAEDATQEVFANLFEAMPRYEARPGRPFRAWMFVVARNEAIARLREQGRLEPMDPAELDRLREEVSEPVVEEEPLIHPLDWITDPELLMFVERLTPLQRQVLLLRHLLDLPNEEIAAILGRSPNEVRVLHHRATRFLRDRLAAIGRGPEAERDDSAMSRCGPKARVLRERRFSLWN